MFQRSVQTFLFKHNTPIGITNLLPSVFAAPVRKDIMHKCVVHDLGEIRGVQTFTGDYSKGRKEMGYSGHKVQQQKGGGRARVGDRGSPIRVGGGRAFPRKVLDHRIGIQSKVYDFGLRSALTSKLLGDQLQVIPAVSDLGKVEGRTLLVHTQLSKNLPQQIKLLDRVKCISIDKLTVYHILLHDYCVLTVDAQRKLQQKLKIF